MLVKNYDILVYTLLFISFVNENCIFIEKYKCIYVV